MSDRPVEIDHGRRHDPAKRIVERCDPLPIRLVCSSRPGMAGGEGGLESIGSVGAAERFGTLQGGETAADQKPVPASAVLFGQGNRRSVRRYAGAKARRLDVHQGQQAKDLGLVGHEAGEDSAETLGLCAQGRADQVLAGSGRVALVEDQVDRPPAPKRGAHLVPCRAALRRQAGVAKRLLGADDALGNGRLAREESAGDFVRRQPADQAQGQRSARLARQYRMAGGKDQAEQFIAEIVVERRLERLDAAVTLVIEVATDLGVLALEPFCSGGRCRWRGVWRSPSARRRDCPEHRSSAIRRARSRARPAPVLRRGRRRAPCGRGRR